MRAVAFVSLLFLAACAAETKGVYPANTAPRPDATQLEPGSPVVLTGQSVWQIFYLPKTWRDEHLADSDDLLAYVLLAGPHRVDLDGAYSPCAPPARIVLGLVGPSSPPREHLARCLRTCGPENGAIYVHRDLWGSFTQLAGVTVQILERGSIDVIQHYRERQSIHPQVAEDPLVVDKLRLGNETRIRHDVIEPSEFRFSGIEADSCSPEPR